MHANSKESILKDQLNRESFNNKICDRYFKFLLFTSSTNDKLVIVQSAMYVLHWQ